MIKEICQGLIAICILGGLILGAVTYFARASDLQLVEMRLDQKIIGDQIMQTKQRIWALEDRNAGPPNEWKEIRDKDEHRALSQELEYLKMKQDKLK